MSSSVINLDSLVGLSTAKRVLHAVHDSNSRIHAILFFGQKGSGKTTISKWLAQSWLCPNAKDGSTGCGECAVCTSFSNGRCVDFQHIKPKGPSALIKRGAFVENENDKDIDTVPLTDYFRSRPLMAVSKVALISDAHRMNQDASNAFLQLLEEPPNFARIILTTHEFSRVPATIRSRCLCVACELPDKQGITSRSWRVVVG